MPQIEIIPCLSDNYAYLIKSGDSCAVVDPSEPGPVRAALAALEKEGLLSYVPKRGFEVRQFSIDEIIDVYRVRSVLEAFACPPPTSVHRGWE